MAVVVDETKCGEGNAIGCADIAILSMVSAIFLFLNESKLNRSGI
jgi:hypothetical protein